MNQIYPSPLLCKPGLHRCYISSVKAWLQQKFFGKMKYEQSKLKRKRGIQRLERDKRRESKNRFHKYLWKLQRDGLINKSKTGKISITSKGQAKRDKIKNSLPQRNYKKIEGSNLIIISFDIPEKYRNKRDWFREILKNLGFEMVHKSTWVGKIKIPEKLIIDLEKIQILECIKIFEISKTGTLKELK